MRLEDKPLPQEAEHSVRSPFLQTKGSWVSGGRSVRGGIRAFLLGPSPRGRVLSGGQRSNDGGENTEVEEEEEEGKEGTEIGGNSSTDPVRGPGRVGRNIK